MGTKSDDPRWKWRFLDPETGTWQLPVGLSGVGLGAPLPAPTNDRCRALRAALGFTQKDMAVVLGCSLESVRSYEAGRRRPRAYLLELISAMEWFMNEGDADGAQV